MQKQAIKKAVQSERNLKAALHTDTIVSTQKTHSISQKHTLDKKGVFLTVLKYTLILAVFISLSNASFYSVRPFGAAFYFAAIFLNLNILILSPLFLIGEVLGGGLFGLAGGAVVVLIAVLTKLILIKTKRKIGKLMFIPPLVSFIAPLSWIHFTGLNALHIILHAAVCVGFTYAALAGLRPVVKEKLAYKMTEVEVFCVSLVLILLSAGLSAYPLFGFPLVAVIAVYAIYLTANVTSPKIAVMVGLIFGLGHSIFTYDIFAIGTFGFIALLATVFVSIPKIIMPLAGLAAFIIFRFFFYFDLDGALMWIIAVAIAGLLYMLTPKKYLKYAKDYLSHSHGNILSRYMVNRDRQEMGVKLQNASVVFGSMADTLSTMENSLPDYRGSLKNKVCALCENNPRCYKNAYHDAELEKLLQTIFNKNRVAVSDISEYLTDTCSNLAKLMSCASKLLDNRKAIQIANETETKSRQIVAEQMYGMTAVLNDFAYSALEPINLDNDTERILIEELNYASIACAGAVTSKNKVSVVLRTESFDKKVLAGVVSRVLKTPYQISVIDNSVIAGFLCVNLTKKPKYDAVFGVSGDAKGGKNNKSGDTHSFIKLSDYRLMMVLCDGMGSGKTANKISETAINLIENFYRAGFSSELVLKSVNKFLSINGGEKFSALDIVLIDLNTLKTQIMKLGSPATYLKRKDTVQRIDGQSVPIGLLDTVEPNIINLELSDGDIIVLTTDGISDNFKGDKLSAVINNIKTLNPVTLADSIQAQAKDAGGGKIKDDSTALVARIIHNS